MPETIYIYDENCIMAGREVPQRELERYSNPADGGDWTGYEATADNAAYWEGKGGFGRKIAATLRPYI